MAKTDLILLHPPSVYDFREKSVMYGPVSDVVPSTQIFEMYPIGFMTMREYLQRYGYSVRIINVALRMLRNRRFSVEKLIKSLNPMTFGIDLHWLVHAQGSLELAGIVKKYHPEIPVVFGGITSSYYHKELIQYPQVDYVIRGDSAEEPLRQLLSAVKEKSSLEDVSNLTWQKDGQIRINELSHLPSDLNEIPFDYRSIMRSSAWHLDLLGHLPFRGWLNYPIVAAINCRGCVHNCVLCGGSTSAYRSICERSSPAYRSPHLVAEDIGLMAGYLKAPIIIVGDILQAGIDHARDLLNELKEWKIKNHIAFELFTPPSKEFLEMVAAAVPNFNIQISPDSHDEKIRKKLGRDYDNASLERSLKDALELGCKRVDIFFMIGLPGQTPQSVKETIGYCGNLMEKYRRDGNGRIRPYISPLAPFLDPGSRAFENPEKFGYRIFHRTLAEHRQALLSPSWKYTLNYETEWMSRDELVSSTYEAAFELNRLKLRYGLLNPRAARRIEQRIEREKEMIEAIDNIFSIRDNPMLEQRMKKIMSQYNFKDHSTMCNKEEMKWPVKFFRFNMFRIIQAMLSRVFRESI